MQGVMPGPEPKPSSDTSHRGLRPGIAKIRRQVDKHLFRGFPSTMIFAPLSPPTSFDGQNLDTYLLHRHSAAVMVE